MTLREYYGVPQNNHSAYKNDKPVAQSRAGHYSNKRDLHGISGMAELFLKIQFNRLIKYDGGVTIKNNDSCFSFGGLVMILYHGSEQIVITPIFGKGNKNNDYGRGFYCTESEELAKEWACANNKNGFANKYEFNMSGLKVLHLNSEEYNLLNWLAVLTAHRTYWENSSISEIAKKYLAENFMIDTKSYDVIIGYRADDSYFTFAQDFVAGAISYRQLGDAMRLGRLGEQIVLMSEKAFSRIKFISSIPADASVYYKKKKERDTAARKEYRKTKSTAPLAEELFIVDIMRGGMKQNDERLR